MSPRAGSAGSWVQPPPMRVLVVEDSPNDVRLIKRAFRKCAERPQVFYVNDGEKALDFVHMRYEFEEVPRPDIIITNLNMPKISGHEVLQRIKSDERLATIPVIILTVSQREADMHRDYSSGAAGFFCKPVDEDEFVSVVLTIYEYWKAAWVLSS